MIKRYIVFDFDHYYPNGGLGDIVGSFDTVEEASEAYLACKGDEFYVLDRDTWKIIQGHPPTKYDQKTNIYTPIL